MKSSYLKTILREFPITLGIFIGWFGIEAGIVLANPYHIYSIRFVNKLLLGICLVLGAAAFEVRRKVRGK